MKLEKSVPCVGLCLCVCRSVLKVHCGKTAYCIRMPFGVVTGVGRWMRILDRVHVGGDALFPNDFERTCYKSFHVAYTASSV